jgi:hypothetical protein
MMCLVFPDGMRFLVRREIFEDPKHPLLESYRKAWKDAAHQEAPKTPGKIIPFPQDRIRRCL